MYNIKYTNVRLILRQSTMPPYLCQIHPSEQTKAIHPIVNITWDCVGTTCALGRRTVVKKFQNREL